MEIHINPDRILTNITEIGENSMRLTGSDRCDSASRAQLKLSDILTTHMVLVLAQLVSHVHGMHTHTHPTVK